MELEGNSNSGTSVAFLKQLRERHPGPLRVIWDNAPAHRGEAMREYLRTPELELRLVNPRFHEGRLCRDTARTSTPMRLSGAGRGRACPRENGGGHWQSVPGQQGGGAGAGRQLPGRAVQPERRCETALPDGPAIKGRNTPSRFPPRFPAPSKCTSHLGFGLGRRLRLAPARAQHSIIPPTSRSCPATRRQDRCREIILTLPYAESRRGCPTMNSRSESGLYDWNRSRQSDSWSNCRPLDS